MRADLGPVIRCCSVLWAACTLPVALAAPVADVIPAPAEVITGTGSFTLRDGMRFVMPADPRAARVAGYFTELLRETRGVRLLPAGTGEREPVLALQFQLLGSPTRRAAAMAHLQDPEAYAIDVSSQVLRVSARDPRGLLYGAVTLWQLCTPGTGGDSVSVPALHLTDWPRFRWRGLLLDSARHYQAPRFILQLLDWMALHKLNVLHWHLTDDQGWRLQILKYPRLTEVGAWRVPAGRSAAQDIDRETGRPRLYGGFYSQDVVRQIVAHAAERNITIVPEIELPGHATAALVAYPHLATVQPAPRSVPADWGVYPNLYNAEPATFSFLEDVLTEVLRLFPGRYIHVGGDEALEDQWKASPRMQRRMQQLGVADAHGLHGYFVRRLGRFLLAHHRRLVGWDEILGGGLPADAAVMSWRGVQGAVSAAQAGHDVILAPAPQLYFDNRQGELPDEPAGRGRIITVEDVYRFEPLPPSLAALPRHVLGVQANLWTEYIRTERDLEAMVFPRLAALAEVGWSQPADRDWSSFTQRLVAMMRRYDSLGIGASADVFSVHIDARPARSPQVAKVTLTTQAQQGQIRYTIDGQDPTAEATLYKGPFETAARGELRAALWIGAQRPVGVRAHSLELRALLTRTSLELHSCTDKVLLYLEDESADRGHGAHFLLDILNPCWIYAQVDLSQVHSIAASVGELPFNFQLGADAGQIVLTSSRDARAELGVWLDRCAGDPLASLPLDTAQHPGVSELPPAALRASGTHDLCLRFSRPAPAPMWALERVSLGP